MPCKRLTTKKYTTRKSPPYPANAPGCRGKRRKGNDGTMYVSKPNKHRVYRWVKVTSVAAKSSKTRRRRP